MSRLVVDSLSIDYDGRRAVCDVSFSLEKGEFLAVVGENGSGKSTLIKGIIGVLPPSAGTVSLSCDGRPGIGYLPQQTKLQRDFPASVREVVLSGSVASSGFAPFYSAEDKRRAARYMDELAITGLAGRSYRELSGGEQQRALLARAFCAARDLLVLDEPTAGLDPLISAEFYELVARFNSETGITTVMVTHDVAAAVHCADKILHMGSAALFFGGCGAYTETELGKNFTGCRHD
ncbi:metal ABC transporter ATP-binding protein [Synergistaceae bacterium OttesenSCG-928-D05]|nr:metal ABC transporter ATP-binding protein [Synergistaceae bacterium OttesenSCG-928-D05]